MSLSKKAAKAPVVSSRELTVDELTQVGGALYWSDSGAYDSYGGYDGYEYGGGGGAEYFYDYSYSDYSWSNPQTEYFDYGIQTVYVTGEAWSEEAKTEWNYNFNDGFNDCWNNTSALEGVAMAIGGTTAEGVFTGAGWVGVGEFFSAFNDVSQAIQDFNERAGEVGYRFAYCEYKAQSYAYDLVEP